jgi:xanthine dehydrogenase iron-sulfur cluster and FAD-binding subunit A
VNDSASLLGNIWNELLSGQAERVRIAFIGLDKIEQQAVLVHLQEMAEGEGWQEGQQESAKAALKAIRP